MDTENNFKNLVNMKKKILRSPTESDKEGCFAKRARLFWNKTAHIYLHVKLHNLSQST